MTQRIDVKQFASARRGDFDRLHCPADGSGWCHCVAWWTPTWAGWSERAATQNRALRDELCARGEYDGYLLYIDDVAVGWCQVGPRDRLPKLVEQFGLTPDPTVWAITCFLIEPNWRRRGLAARLLAEVVRDLRTRGVKRIEAFPKRGADLDSLDLWNGPEAMFAAAGFAICRDDPIRPVLALELKD